MKPKFKDGHPFSKHLFAVEMYECMSFIMTA